MEARDVRPQQGGLAMGQAYLPQDVCAMRCGVLCVVLIFWLSTTAIDGKKKYMCIIHLHVRAHATQP